MQDLFYWLAAIIVVLLSFLYYWSISTLDYWKKRNVPYVKPIPLFGNLLPFVSKKANYTDFLNGIYRSLEGHRFGGYFEMREPILCIRDPTLVHAINVKDFSHFHDRDVDFFFDPSNRELNPLSGHLFAIKGDRWRTLRQKLSPVFTSNKLNGMQSQIDECVSKLEQVLKKREDGPLEIREITMNFMIDVIGSCAFGLNCNSQECNVDSEFYRKCKKTFLDNNYALKFLLLTINPKLLKFFKISDLPKDVTDFFQSIIMKTIEYRESVGEERKDYLQMMMDIKNGKMMANAVQQELLKLDDFDDTDIAANAFVFFGAGFETTSNAIMYCLYHLTLNQDIQEKLRQEIEAIKKNHPIITVRIALSEFKYMDMVISETLRLHPPVPIFRVCTKDYQIPGTDVLVQKGTKVVVPNYAIQNDPKIFPNPAIFDPERFSGENRAKIPSGTYTPFGEGPRYCIGIRFAQAIMKIGLAEIIWKYRLLPNEKTENPLQYMKGIPLRIPRNGIWVNINKITTP